VVTLPVPRLPGRVPHFPDGAKGSSGDHRYGLSERLAFTPDESVLYVNDNPPSRDPRLRYAADGSCGPKRLFHKLAGASPASPTA